MIHVEITWNSGIEKYSFLSMQFENSQAQPRLLSIANISRAMSIDSYENTTVEIVLSDHDGYFTEKLETQEKFCIGNKIRIIYYTGEVILTAAIAKFPMVEDKKLRLKADIFTLLKAQVNKVIDKNEFPSTPVENAGKPGNIIYGKEKGRFVAYRINTNTYLAAWNKISDITKVENTNYENITTLTSYYTGGDGYTYISYTSTDLFIYFYAKGPEESGTLITNPGKMLLEIITNFTDLEFEDLTHAIQRFENRSHVGALFICDDTTDILNLLQSFQQSFAAKPFLTKEGKLDIAFLKFGDSTPMAVVDKTEIKNFQKWKEVKYCRTKWTRQYEYDPNSKQYNRTPADLFSTEPWSTQVDKFGQVFLVDDLVSFDIGSREAYIRSFPLFCYSFSIPPRIALQIEIGDDIQFCHRESYHPEENRLLHVLRIEKENKTGFYKIEGFDILEYQQKGFVVKEQGDPNPLIIYESGDYQNPNVWWSN